MILPQLEKWSAGNEIDAAALNDVAYGVRFALNPPRAWVVATSQQTISSPNTWTGINMDTVVVDREVEEGFDPMWTAATPSMLYCETPGWYHIEAFLQWATCTDSTVRLMHILHTGADTDINTSYARRDDVCRGSDPIRIRADVDIFLNEGDTIQLRGYSSVAGIQTLADPGVNSERTGLRMRWYSL